MLYANGFLVAGVAVAALLWRASADVAERRDAAAAGAAARPRRTAAPCATDIEALDRLSVALESHTVPHHRLTEPDQVLAAHATAAAAAASGRTRETLLSLADSARRSALAFLVDYHLAAGGWEAATGRRMSAPALDRA